MLTSEQFDRARSLALRLAGIELRERHREILERRCRRIDILGATGVDSLLDAVEDGEPGAERRLLGLITTRVTGFFRHPRHFDEASARALRAVERRGRAALWSAAASTGEEPYSMAIALLDAFGIPDPPVTILATDVNEEALAAARGAEYGESALGALGLERRTRYCGEAAGTTRRRLAPAVRNLVEFRALNLAVPAWPIEGPLDVIFCRNVLMYLETGCRRAVVERMAALLAPDGVLILDPVEHLGSAGHLFAPGKDGIYSVRASRWRP